VYGFGRVILVLPILFASLESGVVERGSEAFLCGWWCGLWGGLVGVVVCAVDGDLVQEGEPFDGAAAVRCRMFQAFRSRRWVYPKWPLS
jgi:hypothetical protein